ncbi:DNA gyrase inhibitor YacG [Tropicimonas sp. TH_r6]|uniref:DNA gyrase inhibitor YacG n=1 Tax=Tropicimonas sp. TH_r6 TaxID=3082085 RepID=UPI002952D5A9|nr:DNA gyrase inhibitor YacG [Tropicimonas sp. TH_r6]MDV7145898.1 DNA gyrase inhibitor YacG [Tropicimonas sp. TH_r6]
MTCPICQKEGQARYRPFCSRRCADIDLAHWLRGNYAIPTEESAMVASSETDKDPVFRH